LFVLVKVAAHHFEEDSRRYRHIAGRDKFATVLRRLNRRRKAMALEKLIYVRTLEKTMWWD
jgi:hypothetical protein